RAGARLRQLRLPPATQPRVLPARGRRRRPRGLRHRPDRRRRGNQLARGRAAARALCDHRGVVLFSAGVGRGTDPPYRTKAAAFPAIQPVVHAAWKLKPPVMPSMSSTSPAKCRPGRTRLSIARKSTSLRRTPPHVTNSSLNRLFPTTGNSAAVTRPASVPSAALATLVQGVAGAIPAA